MGKSKKKINSDKINILRKQYDAFQEEDKKRKERNEHILEKLDKIRLSSTVARYKPNVYLDQRVTFSGVGEAPINIKPPHPQTNNPAPVINSIRKYQEAMMPTELDVLSKPINEAYIISEISKKYILIPKLRSNVSDDYIPRAIKQDNNNDNDWKSKYSILDKLKQNEKEETIDYSALNSRVVNFSDDIPSKESKYRIGDEGIEIPPTRDVEIKDSKPNAPNPLEYLDNKKDMKLSNYTVKAEKDETVASQGRPDTSQKSNPAVSRDLKQVSELANGNNNAQKNLMDATEGQQIQPGSKEYNYPIPDVHKQIPFIGDRHNDPAYNDKHENEDTEKVSPVIHDISHVEVIGPIKPTLQETNTANENVGNADKVEYPIDIINVPDFTPADDVTLVDGVNINPDRHEAYYASNQQNVSDPAVSNTQAYLPGANYSPGGSQNVSDPTTPSEQAYLPEANHTTGAQQFASQPTAISERKDLPDRQTGGDQYVSEQPVPAEQAPVVENKDNVLEQQVTNDPNIVDTMASEIEAFETEQDQMFYSEQANYQDYNQDGPGDYNPGDKDYDTTRYYEGVQQEEAYPVEINEHEETEQRYDPHYEQQYGGVEEQQYVEQQQYTEDQQYAEPQQYTEDQQYAEHYAEQQQYLEGQQYVEGQQYDQQYGEQQYDEQKPHLEQSQYGEQLQSELGVISTAHSYDQGQGEAVNEQQAIEEIEQQLDDEELKVPSQEGNAGAVVDESVLYTQNQNNVNPTQL